MNEQTTPSIHSDPAGEFNWAEVHKDAYDFAMNTLHWVPRDAMHFAKGASWKARQSTPQTGRTELQETTDLLKKEIANSYLLKEEIRLLKEQTGITYTEGEVKDFAEWCSLNGKVVQTSAGNVWDCTLGKLKTTDYLLDSYLKQNPKP